MEEERSLGENLKRIGTLGGPLKINKDKMGLYLGNKNHMSKESLFGIHGSLYPGLGNKEQTAVEANRSDTRATLIRELTDQSGFTKREAEEIVNEMIRRGTLVEINDPDLGKVLVFKGG